MQPLQLKLQVFDELPRKDFFVQIFGRDGIGLGHLLWGQALVAEALENHWLAAAGRHEGLIIFRCALFVLVQQNTGIGHRLRAGRACHQGKGGDKNEVLFHVQYPRLVLSAGHRLLFGGLE